MLGLLLETSIRPSSFRWCLSQFRHGLKSSIKDVKAVQNSSPKITQCLKKPVAFSLIAVPLLGVRTLIRGPVKCQLDVEKPVQQNVHKTNWNVILLLLWEDFWTLLGAIIASVIAAFINTLIPLSLGKVVNEMASLVKNEARAESVLVSLKESALSLISLYSLQSLTTFVYITLLAVFGERLAVKLRNQLYASILRQDVEFFDRRRTGELIDCLSNDVGEFKSAFKICINQGLKSLTQVAGCVITLFYVSPLMTSAMIVVIPSVIVVGTLFGSALRVISHKAQAQGLVAVNLSEEVIGNIRTVKAFGNEDNECNAYDVAIQEASRLNIILGCGIGIFQAGTNLFLNVIVLGTLYVGSLLINSQKLSPGDLMSFLVATQTIQRSFAQLSLLFGHIIKGKFAAIRIINLIETKPKMHLDGDVILNKNELVPSVEFKNVSFSYPTRSSQIVLKDLNLVVPAGKTVAIVGASGNGKSTIVSLLERFYDVTEGDICVSGNSIRNFDLTWYRQSVLGLINQEPTLFATSIKENIRYGKPGATDQEVYDAARMANADAFIRSFPEGYETVLGERGLSVSGGQKQRIALARVLLKNPPILILDEATSALDPDAEASIQKTLEKVYQGRTVFIIAHRLSTVQNADTIIVLNEGRVVEIGDHFSLYAKKGIYYNMVVQQMKKSSNLDFN